jgi:hypothetical protein
LKSQESTSFGDKFFFAKAFIQFQALSAQRAPEYILPKSSGGVGNPVIAEA